MRKRFRVYLPKQIRWLILPIFVFIWSVITYGTFATPGGAKSPDLTGWLVGTIVLLIVAVFLWMQTSGRWPVYIVELEEDETPK